MTTPEKPWCCSSDCCHEAEWIVYWPGQTRPMCFACLERARRIAKVMGFHLAAERIEQLAGKES